MMPIDDYIMWMTLIRLRRDRSLWHTGYHAILTFISSSKQQREDDDDNSVLSKARKFGSITARKVYVGQVEGHVEPAGYQLKPGWGVGGWVGGVLLKQRHSRMKWSIKWVKRLPE